MRYDHEGKSLIVLHNFSGQPRKANMKTPSMTGRFYDLWDSKGDVRAVNDMLAVELPGYGYRWYRADEAMP